MAQRPGGAGGGGRGGIGCSPAGARMLYTRAVNEVEAIGRALFNGSVQSEIACRMEALQEQIDKLQWRGDLLDDSIELRPLEGLAMGLSASRPNSCARSPPPTMP